jgi:drug/metabolite transporter superfamily protein YnfA
MNARADFTKTDGVAAAAVLASAIGVFITGSLTTLAEISESLKTALDWSGAVGPLIGKTGVGVIVWLIVWPIFHALWRGKVVNFSVVYTVSVILIALGWLLTFPPVFEAFSG